MQRNLMLGLGGVAAAAASLAAWLAVQNEPVREEAAVEPFLLAAQEPVAAAGEPVETESGAAEAVWSFGIDVARIGQDGASLVAGRASPLANVIVEIDGAEVARSQSESDGQFVALFSLGNSNAAQVMSFRLENAEGESHRPEDVIALLPRPEAAPLELAPEEAVVEAVEDAGGDVAEAEAEVESAQPEQASEIAEPTQELAAVAQELEPAAQPIGFRLDGAGEVHPIAAAPRVASNVTIESIAYSERGEVQISGRATATASSAIRVYLDNEPVALAQAEAGDWRLDLPEIDPGVYTLRVDELTEAGGVVSRFETPFLREAPEAVIVRAAQTVTEPASPDIAGEAARAPEVALITVQPGHSLWRISREAYGDGLRYVQIFNENRAQIRDPNLIYPGQIFTLPP